MSIKRLQDLIMLPYYAAHEACHYAAARLLGLEATFHRYNVVFYPSEKDWRSLVVRLFPSMVGIAFQLFAIWLAFHYQDIVPAILALGVNAGWQWSCLGDYYDVWLFFRRGHWEKNGETLTGPRSFREIFPSERV